MEFRNDIINDGVTFSVHANFEPEVPEYRKGHPDGWMPGEPEEIELLSIHIGDVKVYISDEIEEVLVEEIRRSCEAEIMGESFDAAEYAFEELYGGI